MGQQQLILLVLATVIVGLAIVVGIDAFNSSSEKANADAMMQDAVRIANDIQAWKKKAEPFGGATASETYSAALWADIGYTSSGNTYENLNGEFTLGDSNGGAVITGTSYVDNTSGGTVANEVQVAVCGPDDADVDGLIMTLNQESVNTTSPGC